MDGVKIQSRVYRGYAIAAKRIGLPFRVYRPTNPLIPIGSGSLLTTLPASFVTPGTRSGYLKAGTFDDYLWSVLIDGAQVREGDLLVNDVVGTFFIAAMQPLLPILTVKANRLLSHHRPRQNTRTGGGALQVGSVSSYSSETAATATGDPSGEDTLVTGSPASIRFRSAISRVAQGGSLPGDTNAPGVYDIMVPKSLFPLGAVHNRDILIDDQAKRYQVEDAYFAADGYVLRARMLEV